MLQYFNDMFNLAQILLPIQMCLTQSCGFLCSFDVKSNYCKASEVRVNWYLIVGWQPRAECPVPAGGGQDRIECATSSMRHQARGSQGADSRTLISRKAATTALVAAFVESRLL